MRLAGPFFQEGCDFDPAAAVPAVFDDNPQLQSFLSEFSGIMPLGLALGGAAGPTLPPGGRVGLLSWKWKGSEFAPADVSPSAEWLPKLQPGDVGVWFGGLSADLYQQMRRWHPRMDAALLSVLNHAFAFKELPPMPPVTRRCEAGASAAHQRLEAWPCCSHFVLDVPTLARLAKLHTIVVANYLMLYGQGACPFACYAPQRCAGFLLERVNDIFFYHGGHALKRIEPSGAVYELDFGSVEHIYPRSPLLTDEAIDRAFDMLIAPHIADWRQ
eukprot:gnl/Ergobibamus_cyprinoides/4257.p1 GENE.gnl/Ergobibamus_cyprinoides/4257~~gnl/Ergobibamus_cyprinoides/4257.p1  ORF type:complete len:296 (-),score=52.34 gnl/Ergobibamus_cyprinoides/4257:26-841(-)